MKERLTEREKDNIAELLTMINKLSAIDLACLIGFAKGMTVQFDKEG